MKKEKLIENIRIYSHSKALLGSLFLIFVVGVFMYIILGSNIFLVSVDGHNKNVITTRNDMQGVIDISKIELAGDDVVEFVPALDAAGSLTVRRAFYVDVTADNYTETISVVGGTVKDAVDACGIELGDDDEVTPSLGTALSRDMDIRVSHVKYNLRQVQEGIPYATKTYRSADHIRRSRTVTRKGEKGIKVTTYRDKYVDGERVSSTVVSVTTKKKPVDELVALGTSMKKLLEKHEELAKLRASGKKPTTYKKCYTMEGTAYSYSSNEKYNVTACGTPVREGAVAVDPRVIPYGTILYVESVDGGYVYGYCIAEDTGGGIKGMRIDLFYENAVVMNRFGRRDVRVYVIG